MLAVHLPPALAARLNMLNVRPGAQVRMLRTAPFSGGFMLDAGGVHIALRRFKFAGGAHLSQLYRLRSKDRI